MKEKQFYQNINLFSNDIDDILKLLALGSCYLYQPLLLYQYITTCVVSRMMQSILYVKKEVT